MRKQTPPFIPIGDNARSIKYFKISQPYTGKYVLYIDIIFKFAYQIHIALSHLEYMISIKFNSTNQ